MARKRASIAIAYDFDGTLAPGNMQEYDFVPSIKMDKDKFWTEVGELAKEQEADQILSYMQLMLEKARSQRISVGRKNFVDFGKSVELFKGVEGWFDRVNAFAKEKDVKLQHFIISSGIREMIEGTPIAKYFEKIYASSFMYDHNDVAHWPALAVNYTTKTQYLFRINKGNLDIYDNTRINAFVPKDDRPVPFENMIFLGDGETDIPCFRLVKEQGGHSIAVYQSNTKGAKTKAEALIEQGRVNFACKADYSEGSDIEVTVKAVIDKIAADQTLFSLGKIE